MKNNVLRFYMLAFFLVSNFAMFAAPGANDNDGALEAEDAPPASINSKLIYLIIIGFAFAFYHFSKNRKVQAS